MKSDLDATMQANNIDVLLVLGPAQHNPAMYYLTGGGHLTRAEVIKKRGEPAVLFHWPMERDEAAKSGLETRNSMLYPYRDLLAEAGGDRGKVDAVRYARMLQDLGVTSGRVALYGVVELSSAFATLAELQRRMPELEFVGDPGQSVIGAAMITKDSAEIERIRRMGKITTEVVGRVQDFLTSRPVDEHEQLIGPDEEPLTIGRVKGLINLWLAELGADNPEGTIFAIGRDAGVPHSAGNPTDVMRLGQTIVFDIYPCEQGGGYYYDFTRTWCLGYAPAEVQAIYNQVREVYDTLVKELQMGQPFGIYQERACELFEQMGHPSVKSKPETMEGYVHGIGHGIGLKIHERPLNSSSAPTEDLLVPGVVITIEPGLYYPSKGYGVRLENSLVLREDGTFEVLSDYPMDLVLKMKGS